MYVPHCFGCFQMNRSTSTCRSIVTILTLEVTGIPQLSSDRHFSWPKPVFIQPAKTHTFEVGAWTAVDHIRRLASTYFAFLSSKLSMFESDFTDFIIPLGLYSCRLTELEAAVREDGNPRVEAYYAKEDGPSDSEYILYEGRFESLIDSDDQTDPNLCGSGYGSIVISWDSDSTGPTDMSPWEMRVKDSRFTLPSSRPSLNETEKGVVRDAIASIKDITGVEDVFLLPVNDYRYSDYPSRVEVPMDLTFVLNRLEADYYGSRPSVVADVRLIRDNCIKYNGENDELSDLASQMFNKFEELVLTREERRSWHEIEVAMLANAPQRVQHSETVTEQRSGDSTVTRRTSQRRVRPRSSLENLPRPNGRNPRAQQQSLLRSTASESSRARGTSRSVLEQVNAPTQGEPLDSLGVRGRTMANLSEVGRFTRSRRMAAVPVQSRVRARPTSTTEELTGPSRLRTRSSGTPQEVAESRRSARGRATTGSYIDPPSDIDEQLQQSSANEDEKDNFESPAEGSSEEDDTAGGDQGTDEDSAIRPTRRSARRGLRSRGFKDDSESSDDEHVPKQQAKPQLATRTTDSESDEELQERLEASCSPSHQQGRTRHSNRNRKRFTPEDDLSDKESKPPLNQGRRSKRVIHERQSPRRQARMSNISYTVPSSSDVDSDSSPKVLSNKRQHASGEKIKGNKKCKTATSVLSWRCTGFASHSSSSEIQVNNRRKIRKTEIPSAASLPSSPRVWPEIDLKRVTDVTCAVLERLVCFNNSSSVFYLSLF